MTVDDNLYFRCLQVDSWRIVSGGDDKTLKVSIFFTVYSFFYIIYAGNSAMVFEINLQKKIF